MELLQGWLPVQNRNHSPWLDSWHRQDRVAIYVTLQQLQSLTFRSSMGHELPQKVLHWMNVKRLLILDTCGKIQEHCFSGIYCWFVCLFAIMFLNASFYPAFIGLKVFFHSPIFLFMFLWKVYSFLKFLMLSTSPCGEHCFKIMAWSE